MPYVTTGVLVSPLWSIWSGGLRIKMEANPEAAQGKSSEMCTQMCMCISAWMEGCPQYQAYNL